MREQLRPAVGFPIRPSDRLHNDLGIDVENLECCLEEICERTGRSSNHTEHNPYFGRVETVSDFVEFLESQPRTEAVQ